MANTAAQVVLGTLVMLMATSPFDTCAAAPTARREAQTTRPFLFLADPFYTQYEDHNPSTWKKLTKVSEAGQRLFIV